MKPVSLDAVRDLHAHSQILHQGLLALQHSPLQLRAVTFCKLFQLHASELTRMRLLHQRPKYAPYVSFPQLYRLNVHLFRQFPTMVLYSKVNGTYAVRLYKRYQGHRLPSSLEGMELLPPPFRRKIRPGTTKWFIREVSGMQ